MQLGPHYTPKTWKQILTVFGIEPNTPEDYVFRKQVINIFHQSFYQYIEETKHVKVVPLRRGEIKIVNEDKDAN